MRALAATGLLRAALSAACALACASIIIAALFWMGGQDPLAAFAAILRGSFGSGNRFVSFTLVQAAPLLLAGLAVSLSFRAGYWNIGAEGQLLAGAAAGTAAALALSGLPFLALAPLCLLFGALGGAAWSAIPAWLRARSGVNEVISTLLMNFTALYLVQYLVRGPLQEARGIFNSSDAIPTAAALPALPGTRLHLGFFLGILLATGMGIFFSRTAAGFRLRAMGAAPKAALVSGRIAEAPVLWGVFLGSGALAGLAGWAQVAGVTGRLYESFSPGWGYTAIAVALFARLNPYLAALTAIFFGALGVGGAAMQRDVGVPEVWVRGAEALLVLALLAVDRIIARPALRQGPPSE